MRILFTLLMFFLLVGCSTPNAQNLNWFVSGSEDAENLEYSARFMEALPSDFDSYSYNKYACDARNSNNPDVLECWFSTEITPGRGAWTVKVIIEAESSAEIARKEWQINADLYYSDRAQEEFLNSQPTALHSDSTLLGDSKYMIHMTMNAQNRESYQSWIVYENTKIFVMEENPFSAPLIDDIESIAKNIVDIEKGENR